MMTIKNEGEYEDEGGDFKRDADDEAEAEGEDVQKQEDKDDKSDDGGGVKGIFMPKMMTAMMVLIAQWCGIDAAIACWIASFAMVIRMMVMVRDIQRLCRWE